MNPTSKNAEKKDSAAQTPKTVLQEAQEIVYERRQEGERQYGPFGESMERTAIVASIVCNKEITAEDVYKILAALKFAREGFAHKRDNLLDAIAYLGGLQKYKDKND